MRFSVGDYTTERQNLEIGIISVIVFAVHINLLVKSTENKSIGVVTKSGKVQPPTQTFMDDMSVMAKMERWLRWLRWLRWKDGS